MIQIDLDFDATAECSGVVRKAILSIHQGTGEHGVAWYVRLRTELFIPREASVEILLKEEKRTVVLCERVGKLLSPHFWCGADRPLLRTDPQRKGVWLIGGMRSGMARTPIHETMRLVCRQVFEGEGYSLWETR